MKSDSCLLYEARYRRCCHVARMDGVTGYKLAKLYGRFSKKQWEYFLSGRKRKNDWTDMLEMAEGHLKLSKITITTVTANHWNPAIDGLLEFRNLIRCHDDSQRERWYFQDGVPVLLYPPFLRRELLRDVGVSPELVKVYEDACEERCHAARDGGFDTIAVFPSSSWSDMLRLVKNRGRRRRAVLDAWMSQITGLRFQAYLIDSENAKTLKAALRGSRNYLFFRSEGQLFTRHSDDSISLDDEPEYVLSHFASTKATLVDGGPIAKTAAQLSDDVGARWDTL